MNSVKEKLYSKKEYMSLLVNQTPRLTTAWRTLFYNGLADGSYYHITYWGDSVTAAQAAPWQSLNDNHLVNWAALFSVFSYSGQVPSGVDPNAIPSYSQITALTSPLLVYYVPSRNSRNDNK